VPVRSLSAQGIFDAAARVSPQFVQYRLTAESNGTERTLSQFALPVFVIVPVTRALTVDIGTAYAATEVAGPGGGSTLNGLTDTQLRGNLTLGADFIVLTAGLNLPTGRETARVSEIPAATEIGSDFLTFPISTLGAGFGGTGGLAVARSLGVWNLGVGASIRYSVEYEPFEIAPDSTLRFQPGNEYRARVGIDRTIGNGRLALGFTYSTFGNDVAGGTTYRTSDRYIGQISFANAIGDIDMSVGAWSLYRGTGRQLGDQVVPWDNITNLNVAAAFPFLTSFIEPNVELRSWFEQGKGAPSLLGTFGLRTRVPFGALSIVPSAAYSMGRIKRDPSRPADSNLDVTGFRAALGIQLR